MPLTSHILGNKVCLHVYPIEKFKSNDLTVSFLLPLKEETAALNSLLPRVLTHATQNYPSIAKLMERCNDLYGISVNASTEKKGDVHAISISMTMIRNEFVPDQTDVLAGALDLLYNILFQPLVQKNAFSSQIVQTEKEKLIAEIKSLIGNKRQYANTRLIDEMCKNERFSIRSMGTEQTVNEITPHTLYAHYLQVLKEAQIEIFFIGSCDSSYLTKQLSNMFGKIQRCPIALPTTQIISSVEAPKEIKETQSAKQSNLVLGFRGVPSRKERKKSAAFTVFCNLFGGSPTSKLFMNVREKKSLCYFCRAGAIYPKGIMTIQSGIARENKAVAQDEILHQFSLCQHGEITQEEIQTSRCEIINQYKAIFDLPASLQSYFLNARIADLDYDIDSFIDAIQTVSKEEIITAAQDLILDTVFFLEGVTTEEDA